MSKNIILDRCDFDGLNFDTIQTQLFLTKNTDVEKMRTSILTYAQVLNKGFELGIERSQASLLSLNDEFKEFLFSYECVSLELGDVFIHCKHGLLSQQFYEVLGEDLYRKLVATNLNRASDSKGNLESNRIEDEDLPF